MGSAGPFSFAPDLFEEDRTIGSVTEGGITIDAYGVSEDTLRAEMAQSVATPTVETPVAKPVEADADDDAPEKPAAPAQPVADKAADKKRSIQARIDELTAEKHANARERDAARKDVEDLRRELDTLKRGAAKPEPKADAPTPERFPKYDEYLQAHPDASLEDWMDARDVWRDGQAAKVRDAEARQRHEEQTRAERAGGFSERWAKERDAAPEVAAGVKPHIAEAWPLSTLPRNAQGQYLDPQSGQPKPLPSLFLNFIAEGVFRADHPVKLARYLSDHDAELRRLATVPPDDLLWQLAKLDARFGTADTSGPVAERKEPKSAAPPPIKPVSGSPSAAELGEEPGDDASDDEWLRWRQAQEKRRRRA
jgi:hypothetical protein